MFKSFVKFLFIVFFTSTIQSNAQPKRFSILYDIGGKHDTSFSEAASKGVVKFQDETGYVIREFEISRETQREQVLRKVAQISDYIAVVGYAYTTPLKNVAKEFPKKKFAIIDSLVEQPNVQSILFKEHEGSFLVGMLAALKSKSNVIGFVGGQDIPLIRKFRLGFIEGAKHVNPEAKVITNYIGSTTMAWTNPTKASEIALSQIDRKADVIFAAAGPSGLGVYQAAADRNIFAIGVDSNQNYIHPGHMLSSMIKRVDVAIYNFFKDSESKQFNAGLKSMGLSEDAVGYCVDKYNSALISDEIKVSLENAKNDIISGKIKVTDYLELNKSKKYN